MKIILWLIVLVCAGFIFLSWTENNFDPPDYFQPKTPKDSVRSAQPRLIETKVFIATDQDIFVRESLKEFESFVKSAIANRQAAGAAVAIVKDSSIIFLKGFGLREVGKPDSVNERTVFRIGSVSKSMTATLASTFVRDSIFQWDDQLIKYLPNFKLKSESATQQLKLRHILSHTEGLPYHAYTIMVDKRAPADTLIEYLQRLNLIAEPGKIYSYQNVGFSLIGKAIEKVSDETFEQNLTEKLFKPLHMQDASASFKKINSQQNVAKPHFLIKPTKLSDVYYSVAPAGGINASAQDMALWLKALLGNNPEVLPKVRLDEIFKPQVSAVSRNYYFRKWKPVRKSFYGLGWRILSFTDGDSIIYHGGFVNNYRCEVAIDRKKKIGIAVMVNSPGWLADQAVPKFLKTYEFYYNLSEEHKRKPKP